MRSDQLGALSRSTRASRARDEGEAPQERRRVDRETRDVRGGDNAPRRRRRSREETPNPITVQPVPNPATPPVEQPAAPPVETPARDATKLDELAKLYVEQFQQNTGKTLSKEEFSTKVQEVTKLYGRIGVQRLDDVVFEEQPKRA